MRAYEPETVYYAGEVVACIGGTWQARKDTGQPPPHADWIGLALAGRDGVDGIDGISPAVKGLWQADVVYGALDIVALNSGSYIARKDAPGPCPGPGWLSLFRQGKPGKDGPQGECGPPGARGERGPAGVSLIAFELDRKGYRAVAKMSDGSELALDLMPLFEQFSRDAK